MINSKTTTTIGGILVALFGVALPLFLSPDCATEVTSKIANIIGIAGGGLLMAVGPSVAKKKNPDD